MRRARRSAQSTVPATSSITTNCGSLSPVVRDSVSLRECLSRSPAKPERLRPLAAHWAPGTASVPTRGRPSPPRPTLPGPRFAKPDTEKCSGKRGPQRSMASWRHEFLTTDSLAAEARASPPAHYDSSRLRILVRSLIRVPQRRTDHVGATGPLSQINQPAALAAKRKFRVAVLHRLSCRWGIS